MDLICNVCGNKKIFHKAGKNEKTGKTWKDFWGCDICYKNKGVKTENKEHKDIRNIGALWAKKSGNGLVYLSGEVEIGGNKTKITVFKNDRKNKPTHPDYNILLSTIRHQEVSKMHQDVIEEPEENLPF
jgi:hypothetical protein